MNQLLLLLLGVANITVSMPVAKPLSPSPAPLTELRTYTGSLAIDSLRKISFASQTDDQASDLRRREPATSVPRVSDSDADMAIDSKTTHLISKLKGSMGNMDPSGIRGQKLISNFRTSHGAIVAGHLVQTQDGATDARMKPHLERYDDKVAEFTGREASLPQDPYWKRTSDSLRRWQQQEVEFIHKGTFDPVLAHGLI